MDGLPFSVRLLMALRRAAGGLWPWRRGKSAQRPRQIVVFEQHRGEVALHAPDDVVGQHAQEDVGGDAMGLAMVDRTDVEVARFDVAEAALGVAEPLVGENEGGGGEAVTGKAASNP